MVNDVGEWQKAECNSVDAGNSYLTLDANLTDDTFRGGKSRALTVEQVYYRYTARSEPPYGYLERYVRYNNGPSGTFPPDPVTWTVVARQLTDFWLEYQDSGGTTLTGDPLNSSRRSSVGRIALAMEGYDLVGAGGEGQRIIVESQIVVRNAGL